MPVPRVIGTTERYQPVVVIVWVGCLFVRLQDESFFVYKISIVAAVIVVFVFVVELITK